LGWLDDIREFTFNGWLRFPFGCFSLDAVGYGSTCEDLGEDIDDVIV
jgi:hypothetical protein